MADETCRDVAACRREGGGWHFQMDVGFGNINFPVWHYKGPFLWPCLKVKFEICFAERIPF